MNLSQFRNRPIAFCWHIVQGVRHYIIGSMLAVAIAELCWGVLPYVSKLLVDTFSAGAPTSEETISQVIWLAVILTVVTALPLLGYRLSGMLSSYWMNQMEKNTYQVIFKHLSQHNMGFFANTFAGSLVSKGANIRSGTWSLWELLQWTLISFVITIASGLYFITTVHLGIGLFVIAWMVGVTAASVKMGKTKRDLAKDHALQRSKRTGQVVDSISNIKTVTLFAKTNYELKRLNKTLDGYMKTGVASWRYTEKLLLINNLLVILMKTIILGAVVYLWMTEQATAGDIVMIYYIGNSLGRSFFDIGRKINSVFQAFGELDEGLQTIAQGHDIIDVKGAKNLKVSKGEISISNITFAYPENNDKNQVVELFRDFNLRIASGEKLGVVGVSGAGKSTLVKLLLRLYETNEGTISIDEQDITKVKLDSLRSHIAVIAQEPEMFHRSIAENICYGNDKATEKDMIKAAKLAQAHEFIMSLPKGYETLVGERGVKLSGGQRQRIAIARAILKNAPILILDEATSALDSSNEVAIQKALHNLIQGKTVIAIAHRLSTLREMDRIVVLDEGMIIQDGTHLSLSKKPGLYQKLWKQQSEGFIHD